MSRPLSELLPKLVYNHKPLDSIRPGDIVSNGKEVYLITSVKERFLFIFHRTRLALTSVGNSQSMSEVCTPLKSILVHINAKVVLTLTKEGVYY